MGRSDVLPSIQRWYSNSAERTEKQTIMSVPMKPNYKSIDALFFKLDGEKGKRGKYKAIVAPTQITIAEIHSERRKEMGGGTGGKEIREPY